MIPGASVFSIRDTRRSEGSAPVHSKGPPRLRRSKIDCEEKSSWSEGTRDRISIVWRRMLPSLSISRSRWTTRSIDEANTFQTTRSGTFSPAIRAALTNAASASEAELAWTVATIPHPALTALVNSNASAPRREGYRRATAAPERGPRCGSEEIADGHRHQGRSPSRREDQEPLGARHRSWCQGACGQPRLVGQGRPCALTALRPVQPRHQVLHGVGGARPARTPTE